MESRHQNFLNRKIRKAFYAIFICSLVVAVGSYGLYNIYFGNDKSGDGWIVLWIITICFSVAMALGLRAILVYMKEKVSGQVIFITVRLTKKLTTGNNSGGKYFYFVNEIIDNKEEYASAYRNCSFTYPKNSETEFWFKVKKQQYRVAKEGMVFKLEMSKDSLTVFSIKRQKELEDF